MKPQELLHVLEQETVFKLSFKIALLLLIRGMRPRFAV